MIITHFITFSIHFFETNWSSVPIVCVLCPSGSLQATHTSPVGHWDFVVNPLCRDNRKATKSITLIIREKIMSKNSIKVRRRLTFFEVQFCFVQSKNAIIDVTIKIKYILFIFYCLILPYIFSCEVWYGTAGWKSTLPSVG